MNDIFSKIEIESGKLNKKIELEAYRSQNNELIVTTTSLKKVFESIKSEFGIKDSFTSEIVTDTKGTVLYATVDWKLEDSTGYSSMFTGESFEATLTSKIARNYPKTMALNRAQSAGIISYLQLPGKTYSDTQVDIKDDFNKPVENNDETDTSETDNKMASSTNASVISEVPDLENMDIMIPINEEEPMIPVEESIPNNDTIEEKTETPEIKNDFPMPAPEEPVSNEAKTEVEAGTDADSNGITGDTLVGCGRFVDVPVKELLELYKNKDQLAVKFVTLCANGSIKQSDPSKRAVIQYIARKSKEL